MTDGYDGPLAEDPDMRPAWKRRGQSATSTTPPGPAPTAPPERRAPEPPALNGATPPAAPPTPAEAVAAIAAGPVTPDPDDLERGRTLALVAALGRLQMSIDVLTREQRKHAEQVEERLARIERRLAGQ